MSKAGCKRVEVRLSSAVRAQFESIDTICGTLSEAKIIVHEYMQRNHHRSLSEWVEGEPDQNGPVYFAHSGTITFRIRQ